MLGGSLETEAGAPAVAGTLNERGAGAGEAAGEGTLDECGAGAGEAAGEGDVAFEA